jgi:hypothetical protein
MVCYDADLRRGCHRWLPLRHRVYALAKPLALSLEAAPRAYRGWPRRLGTVLAWGRARVAVQAEVTSRGERNKKGGLRSTFGSKEAASDMSLGIRQRAGFSASC